MAIEVIDGTVESAVVKRAAARTVLYECITFRTAAGAELRLDKVAVAPDVAKLLQPGAEGRIYGYKAIDHRGLFAIRTRDGRSVFAIPTGNERIMLGASIVGAVGFVVLLVAGKGLGLLALATAVLAGIGWFKYRSTRIEARARFEGDSDYTKSFA